MDIEKIMLKIQQEDITLIQEEITVEFDNHQQIPLGFKWQNRHYEILEPLLVNKSSGGHLNFLVLTDGGVFNVILQQEPVPCKTRWILKYRVNEDVEEEPVTVTAHPAIEAKESTIQFLIDSTLISGELLQVVRYHGHLCPELAVGYRVGLIGKKEMGMVRENSHNFFILAENISPAIDALQCLTGCTIGNQNFYARDLGKHVYYFARSQLSKGAHEAIRIALINPLVDIGGTRHIQQKIMTGKASQTELLKYQQEIDDIINGILNLPEDNLFAKRQVFLRRPQPPVLRYYRKCCSCGEVVAIVNTVPVKEGLLCLVCASKTEREK